MSSRPSSLLATDGYKFSMRALLMPGAPIGERDLVVAASGATQALIDELTLHRRANAGG